MKPIISEALVKRALISLERKGVKATLEAVRAEMGNHGSKTTIVKHLRALKSKELNQSAERSKSNEEINNDQFQSQNSSSLWSQHNDFARLLETLHKYGATKEYPELIEELCKIIADLKQENIKVKNELSSLKYFQRQVIDALNVTAKI